MNKYFSLFSLVIFASIYMASNAHAALAATDHFNGNGVISGVTSESSSTPFVFEDVKSGTGSSQGFVASSATRPVSSALSSFMWFLWVSLIIGLVFYGVKKGYSRFKEIGDIHKPRLIIYK